MTFDIEPKDKYQRFLLYHSESDCLFEVFSEAEKENIMGQEPLVEDVTDITEHEIKFKEQKK